MFARERLPSLLPSQLAEMSQGSRCLERDANGPKVLLLADGDMLKIFYPRKGLSLSRLFPAALAFVRNVQRLRQLGVPTVSVKQTWRLPDGVFAVRYLPLAGDSLRGILDAAPEQETLLRPSLAAFIDELHDKGVYFRSLHLGNIIRRPEGGYGLIDVADLRVLGRPLGKGLIRRNRSHFEHYLRKSRLPFDSAALWAASRNGALGANA